MKSTVLHTGSCTVLGLQFDIAFVVDTCFVFQQLVHDAYTYILIWHVVVLSNVYSSCNV